MELGGRGISAPSTCSHVGPRTPPFPILYLCLPWVSGLLLAKSSTPLSQASSPSAVPGFFSSASFGPAQAWEPLTTLSPRPLPQPYRISRSCLNLSMSLISPLLCNTEPSMKILLPPFLPFQPLSGEDTPQGGFPGSLAG